MSEVSVEKKLQVVKQIREENAKNERLIRGRESVLYGFHSPYPVYPDEMINSETDGEPISYYGKSMSLKIRLVLSLILVVSIIILDKTQTQVMKYTVSDMFTYLETDLTKDFQTNLFDFTSDFPYTTK